MKIKDALLAAAFVGGLTIANVLGADSKETKDKIKPYPLEKCIVSGEKLGSMGSPYVITNGTQEVKFCCKGCLKDFNKDKAGFMKKIEQAKNEKK
jgi:hypothetical protein